MANRAMNAKLQRARKQAREAAQIEFTKPAYILQAPKRELRKTLAAFELVMVHRLPSVRIRERKSRTYNDGTRRGSVLTPDVYAVETRLIRNCRKGPHV